MKVLYAEYYRNLLRIAIDLTGDEEASEDIVQETFVHVWLNAKELGRYHERSIEHYLVRVIRNKAITYYKEHLYISKQMIKFVNGHHVDAVADSPERQMIQVEITREIRDVIAKFPKREYQCLMMKIDEELDDEQISNRLNVTVKAVQRSLTSAKKRLRTHLQARK